MRSRSLLKALLIGLLAGVSQAQAAKPSPAVKAAKPSPENPAASPQVRPGCLVNPNNPSCRGQAQAAPGQMQGTPAVQSQGAPGAQMQVPPGVQIYTPPQRPENMPPTQPQVTFQDGMLSIHANNSTLSSILSAIRQQTGANIELAGAGNERVVANLGPAAPRDVLADLLNGSRYDYVMLGSDDSSGAIQRVILTQRQTGGTDVASGNRPQPGGGAPVVTANPYQPQDEEQPDLPDVEDPQQGVMQAQPEPQPIPPDNPQHGPMLPGAMQGGETGQPQVIPGQQQQPQQGQGEGGESGPKTPEQLLQELQRLQQQQQQQRQQQQTPR